MNELRYANIQQLIREVGDLGDWKDPSQKDKYLKVLSKILIIYNGYEFKAELGDTKGYYPSEVIKAIADVCAKKFPSREEVFDENGNLRPGMPDSEYSNYVTLATTQKGISLLGENGKMGETAKNELGIDVYNVPATEEEVRELIGSAQKYFYNNIEMDKSKIPYYQVAKQSLMNFNNLSEEESTGIIETSSFDDIEGQVGAKGSLDYAIQEISQAFSLTDNEAEQLANAIYKGGDISVIVSKPEFVRVIDNPSPVIIDTLFHVHDGWVMDNRKKFMARDKKYQHMPSELIGWKEVKLDLLFVEPIFEAMGIGVNEQKLITEYNSRVKDFFLNNKITSAKDLADYIKRGEEFYPALADYGEVLNDIKDVDFVEQNIIPSIEKQGIGKIEDVRKEIINQIASNPTPEILKELSESEIKLIETSIGKEVSTLSEEKDKLKQKNLAIGKIMSLAKRRKALKDEIAIEEGKKEQNIQDF